MLKSYFQSRSGCVLQNCSFVVSWSLLTPGNDRDGLEQGGAGLGLCSEW